MIKSIYIGNSLPMTLKAVENYRKNIKNVHKIISISGVDCDLLSNIVWSGLELDLLNCWIEKNIEKKVKLRSSDFIISVGGSRIMFSDDGLKNVAELYRKIIHKPLPKYVKASSNHKIQKILFNYFFHNQFPDLVHFFSNKNLVNILGESLASAIFCVKDDLIQLNKKNFLNGLSSLFFSRELSDKFEEELNIIITKLICGLGVYEPSSIINLFDSKNLFIQKTKELKFLPYSEGFGIIRTSGYDRDVVIDEKRVFVEENFLNPNLTGVKQTICKTEKAPNENNIIKISGAYDLEIYVPYGVFSMSYIQRVRSSSAKVRGCLLDVSHVNQTKVSAFGLKLNKLITLSGNYLGPISSLKYLFSH